MISFSTITSNINGNVIIQELPGSKLKTNTARVSSSPTLDGGTVVLHAGITDQDRPVNIVSKINKKQEAIFWDLLNTESFLLMSYDSNLYLISIKSLSTENGELSLNLYIVNKEN